MKDLIFIVYNKNQKPLIATSKSLVPFFFEVCVNYGEKPAKIAERLANAGWEMYLKDSNDTPIGKLADYLAVIGDCRAFLKLGRREQLDKFYAWYEKEGGQ